MATNGMVSKSWEIVQKALLVVIIALCGWVLKTVDDLQDRVTRVETSNVENEAQWTLLNDHAKQLQESRIEMEVTKRVFELLLSQNKITIDRIALPKLPPAEKRTLEDFKTEQMQRFRKH